jgi:hypothetical protein
MTRLSTLTFICLALAVTACGSGESRTTTTGQAQPQMSRHHHDSASGSEGFKVKGGDNSVADFGREAASAEFAEAAEALHGYLDARAAGAWRTACRYLAPATRSGLVQQFGSFSNQKNPTCAKVIAALSALPESTLREIAVADVASFRVEDDDGFILYEGGQKVRYFVPMKRQNGHWWVAGPSPTALS